MSCFSEDKLPSSFANQIESISSNTIVIRSNIRNLIDCNMWISEFGKLTNTKWNTRDSKPCMERFICSKKFVCHHSSFMKVPAEKNKRSFTKNSKCLATIKIKVKLETAATKRRDPFIQRGLFAVITLNDVHNHSLNTPEALKFLPAADCKEKFIEYFNDGMGIAESCKYHESILKLEDKITEVDMANSRINPPYRAVQHWYDEWRLLNLDPRTGTVVIEKSDLQCSVCNQTFLKKIHLKHHMECHEDLEDSRQASSSSNWCSICKKSFEDAEYKLHIQILHQLIQENTNELEKDPFPESGYVLMSKKRLKREPNIISPDPLNSGRSPKRRLSKYQSENRVDISVANIKKELTDTSDEDECHKSPKRKSFIKCWDCGLRYKGLRGLQLHISKAHKKNYRRCLDNSLTGGSDEIQDDINQNNNQDTVQESDKNDQCKNQKSLNPDSGDNPSLDASNGYILLNQNSQPGLICNMLPCNNILSIGNPPDLQAFPPPGTEGAKIIEIIPKFDPESQIYVKWLKKFVQKCKMQIYPLPSITCENINHVVDEIETAMFNPNGSLKARSSYFYFMKMHKILSEIMSGHMRHSLSVVIK